MKAALKSAGIAALNSRPVYSLLRARALCHNPVTVLCYHTLRPDHEQLDSWLALRLGDFRQQLHQLRAGYDLVSLDDAVDAAGSPGRPKAVLTFDDGELGMHRYLLPLVAEENIPVIVYVATRQIETGQPYWFDRVMNGLQGDGDIRIDLRDAGLAIWHISAARGKARWHAIAQILEALKQAPPAKRDQLADAVIAQAGARPGDFTPLAPMDVAQLQELAANPHVTIGAHSHCHNLLDQIPLSEARDSIVKSRKLLEGWTGQTVRHFAYPNGNFTPALMGEIADLGFASAAVLQDRLAGKQSHAFALPRIAIGRYDSLPRTRLRLVGV